MQNLLSNNSTIRIKYSVPVVNLSNNCLAEKEPFQLSFGLWHSFVNKNKHVKKNLASNLGVVAEKVTHSLDKELLENFHKFLKAHTDILTKNVHSTKYDIYHNLKRIINEKMLAVVLGDKDSCVIITKRGDYTTNMETMIDDGITCGVYTPTKGNTMKDLKTFCDFLYYNFKDHPRYKKTLPTSKERINLHPQT